MILEHALLPWDSLEDHTVGFRAAGSGGNGRPTAAQGLEPASGES